MSRTVRQSTVNLRGTITWRCEADDCFVQAEVDDTQQTREIALLPGWWAITHYDVEHPGCRPIVWHFCSRRCALLTATAALLSDAG